MLNTLNNPLSIMGSNLKALRKLHYPRDDQGLFAARIKLSRATYQKMEKGDPSIAMGSYLRAAELFDMADQFGLLFKPQEKPVDMIKELGL